MSAAFDFAGYMSAVESRDVGAWCEFFADDAVWREYRERNPPSSPNVIEGKRAIRAFLEGMASAPLRLAVSHEVVGSQRVACRLTVTFDGGRRIIEHVILEHAEGKILSQVDVEAWD